MGVVCCFAVQLARIREHNSSLTLELDNLLNDKQALEGMTKALLGELHAMRVKHGNPQWISAVPVETPRSLHNDSALSSSRVGSPDDASATAAASGSTGAAAAVSPTQATQVVSVAVQHLGDVSFAGSARSSPGSVFSATGRRSRFGPLPPKSERKLEPDEVSSLFLLLVCLWP